MAETVCASTFGGPGDLGTGHIGYMGDSLTGKKAFAELKMGTALGSLPHGTAVQITYKGKSVIAKKLDIGAGGPGCGGHPRKIDIWWETARELGFSGLDTVSILVEVKNDAERKKLEKEFPKGMGVNIPEKAEEAVKAPLEWAKELGSVLGFLGSSSGWLRIGKVVLGGVLLIVAIDELSKISPGPNTNAVGGAGKIGKAAGKTPVGKLASRAVPSSAPSDPWAFLDNIPVT